jgi:hypothetical protein
VTAALLLTLMPLRASATDGYAPPGTDVGEDLFTAMVLDPGHHQIFLGSHNSGQVRVYNYRLHHLATLQLQPLGLGQMALSPNGRVLYVVKQGTDGHYAIGSIVAIRTATLTIAWTITAPKHWEFDKRCLDGVAVALGRVWSVGQCAGPNAKLFSFDPAHRDRGWTSAHALADMDWLNTPANNNRHLLSGIRTQSSGSGVSLWTLRGTRAHYVGNAPSGNGEGNIWFTADGSKLAYGPDNTPSTPPTAVEVRRTDHIEQQGTYYVSKDDGGLPYISPTGKHIIIANWRIEIFAAGHGSRPERVIDPSPNDPDPDASVDSAVTYSDIAVTPNGHTLFDVVYYPQQDQNSCCPDHMYLQHHHLDYNTW